MISVNTYNQKGEVIGKTRLPGKIFGVAMNQNLVHQAVVAQMANARQVVAHAKNRGEVRGGGRKPWRQKGTGRARAGSIRSPLWRGGGVTFGPTKERNFSKKINKKMKRKALFMALSSKARDKEMVILDDLRLAAPKTKEIVGILVELFSKIVARGKKKGIFKKDRSEVLLVLPEKNVNLQRASANLSYLKTILADSLNVVDVLRYKYFLVLRKAVKVIEGHYLKENF